MKKIIAGVIAIAMLAGGAYLALNKKSNGPRFRTEKVIRGGIRTSVMATGTVNAVTTVLVGTQVSGTIKYIYVDYNSPVKRGQLLAQVDPATFEAQVDQAKANLLAAKSNLEKAEVSVLDTKRTMERNRDLLARNFVSQSDLDTADTNYRTAVSQVAASNAQIEQTKAALKFAEINLKYTKIVSPVSGTVISRNVDVGQTVAASFQTPTLFTIAQDLTKMQIDTSVDEADIGRAKTGQPVEFTVDAYPEITFKGSVSEVRNAPITVQNVVTYDVVINVGNPDLKLKPGMTANVSIIASVKNDVVKIPNAALRFKPDEKGAKISAQKGAGVWIAEGATPKRIPVVTGISDGNYTELVSGTLQEGSDVIAASADSEKKSENQSAPRFLH